jgi:hypothetical protein
VLCCFDIFDLEKSNIREKELQLVSNLPKLNKV